MKPEALHLRALAFKAFADELRQVGKPALEEREIQPDVFCSLVKEALDDYNVPAVWLGTHFGVTRGAVSRWRNGESAPYPFTRRAVLLDLAEYVEHAGRDIERAASSQRVANEVG